MKEKFIIWCGLWKDCQCRSIQYENMMKITDYYSIYVYNYDSWKFDEILLMGFMFEET